MTDESIRSIIVWKQTVSPPPETCWQMKTPVERGLCPRLKKSNEEAPNVWPPSYRNHQIPADSVLPITEEWPAVFSGQFINQNLCFLDERQNGV